MTKKTKKFFHNLKEMVFPEYCLGCHKIIEKEKFLPFLCRECFFKININHFVFCPVCKKPLLIIYNKNSKKYHIQSCYHSQKKYLSWLGSATFFNEPIVKTLIENYKYKFLKNISLTLSAILIAYLEETSLKEIIKKQNWLITPLPLYPRREKWRGFNQSELIAKEVAKFLEIPYRKDILKRVKPTKEQALLSLKDRFKNIENAFLLNINQEEIRGKKIIIVDDVFTSGATLKEAAKTLKQAGVLKVAGLTIAIALD